MTAATTSRAVLVTGATGLVGNELVDQLLKHNACEVVGASRRGSRTGSEVVAWDMAIEPPPARLRRHWGAIVNAAASTRWTMSPEEATAANVASVRALEPLVAPDTHVIHVSTAYALGLRGTVESVKLEDYRNTYEWSKAHAERVARETFAHLTLVRPTLIVGRRSDGRAARFSGMYTLIRGLTVGTVPAVVANPHARFDAIPVDMLGALLADLATKGDVSERSVLTIAAGAGAPTIQEAITVIVDYLNHWREGHSCQSLQHPPIISPEAWNRFFRPFVSKYLTNRQLLILELLRNFEPYLALTDPLQPDYTAEEILPCLATSTNYWAETNPRVAALTPSPWHGFGSDVAQAAETSHA
jgi:nucleoside-diphosphate-sugar epimerase